MALIRRIYIFLICAISLNALAWAGISLARHLALGIGEISDLALEIAVSVVSLGMFLAHWLWAGRLSAGDPEERQAGLRRFYLVATMAGFLAPLLVNLHSLLANLVGLSDLTFNYPQGADTPTERVVFYLIPIVILALLLGWHAWVVRGDERQAGSADRHTGIRRLFQYGFAAVGFSLVIINSSILLRTVLNILTGDLANLPDQFKTAIPGLSIGLPLWLYFWLIVQRKFAKDEVGARLSSVRKLYQYGFIFASVLVVVANTALLLNYFLGRALGLEAVGDWRDPLPIMLVMGAVWLYQAVDLRREQPARVLTGRAGGIQRLYQYLVAGIGLLAVLAGLVGLIAVILIAIEKGFGIPEREALAATLSALLVGLPVWFLPWRRLQAAARSQNRSRLPEAGSAPVADLQNTIGEEGRTSLVRKIYLYLFIFLATLSVLGGLIFITFRLVSAGLGLGAPTLSGLGIALAFTLIGVCVWLYHGLQLRIDGTLSGQSIELQIQHMNLLAIILPGSPFGEALRARLAQTMPQATLRILETNKGEMSEYWAAQIESARVLLLPLDAWNEIPEGRRQAILSSSARKLLIPVPVEGWSIVGLDVGEEPEGLERIADGVLEALRQVAAGQLVRQRGPLSGWAILGIVLLVMVSFPLVTFLISLVVDNL